MISYEKLQELTETVGDSFYIFKKKELVENIMEFRAAFQRHYKNVNLGYSVKTNYIPYACKLAYDLGSHIEVVSEMELQIAAELNIPTEKIIYNGPIKSIESLEHCLLAGSKVNIDNLSEAKDIVQIAKRHPAVNIKVGVRINTMLGDNFQSRFGFDVNSEDFAETLRLITGISNLHVVGLHTHSTRPDKSVASYLRRLDYIYQVYRKYFREIPLEYIDLGGGFYGKMDENIREQFALDHVVSFEEYGQGIGSKMKEYFPDEGPMLILEPGLAMTVNILDFVCKVANMRVINGKSIATVTGSFHNIKPSGHAKNLTVDWYSVPNKEKIEAATDIVGYTCLENDIVHRDYPYALSVGDFLNFKNVGAYTLVFKPVFIKLAPAIIVLQDDGYVEVKRNDDFDDYFKCYNFKL